MRTEPKLAREIFFCSPVVHTGGFKYSYMMLGWFKIVGLVLLAGFLLGGCAGFPKPEIEEGFTEIDAIYENPEKFQGQEVVLEGTITFDMEYLRLWQPSPVEGGDTYLFLSRRGMITGKDSGFNFRKVIVRGKIKWVDCKLPGASFPGCGVFLEDYNILWIK